MTDRENPEEPLDVVQEQEVLLVAVHIDVQEPIAFVVHLEDAVDILFELKIQVEAIRWETDHFREYFPEMVKAIDNILVQNESAGQKLFALFNLPGLSIELQSL